MDFLPERKPSTSTKKLKEKEVVLISDEEEQELPMDESTFTAKEESNVSIQSFGGGESPVAWIAKPNTDSFWEQPEQLATRDLQKKVATNDSCTVTVTTKIQNQNKKVAGDARNKTAGGGGRKTKLSERRKKRLRKQQRQKREEELKRQQEQKATAKKKKKYQMPRIINQQSKQKAAVHQTYLNGKSSTPLKAGRKKLWEGGRGVQLFSDSNNNNTNASFYNSQNHSNNFHNQNSQFGGEYPLALATSKLTNHQHSSPSIEHGPYTMRGADVDSRFFGSGSLPPPPPPSADTASQQSFPASERNCCRSPNICPGYDMPVYQTPNKTKQQHQGACPSTAAQPTISCRNLEQWNPQVVNQQPPLQQNYPPQAHNQMLAVSRSAFVPLGFGPPPLPLMPPQYCDPQPFTPSNFNPNYYGNFGNCYNSGRGYYSGYNNNSNTVYFRPPPQSSVTFLANSTTTWSNFNNNGNSSSSSYITQAVPPVYQQKLQQTTIASNSIRLMTNGLAGELLQQPQPSYTAATVSGSSNPGVSNHGFIQQPQQKPMQLSHPTTPLANQQQRQPLPPFSSYFSNLQY